MFLLCFEWRKYFDKYCLNHKFVINHFSRRKLEIKVGYVIHAEHSSLNPLLFSTKHKHKKNNKKNMTNIPFSNLSVQLPTSFFLNRTSYMIKTYTGPLNSLYRELLKFNRYVSNGIPQQCKMFPEKNTEQ